MQQDEGCPLACPAEAARTSIVAPARVSGAAREIARRKRTAAAEPFEVLTRPTALQRQAFKLLGVRLERSQ